MVAALRALVENDFTTDFERVDWRIDPSAQERVDVLQPLIAETAYFAARELVRNAAKYARGGESLRKVLLTVRLVCAGEWLRLEIEDDGVGPQPDPGNGSGLRIHGALLAAVGGSLEVSRGEQKGTLGVIILT